MTPVVHLNLHLSALSRSRSFHPRQIRLSGVITEAAVWRIVTHFQADACRKVLITICTERLFFYIQD